MVTNNIVGNETEGNVNTRSSIFGIISIAFGILGRVNGDGSSLTLSFLYGKIMLND